MSTIEAAATTNASAGAISPGMTTLPSTPSALTPAPPTAASIAPTIPPMRACEELDGRPYSQVSRFQVMAPISPANAIVSDTWAASMMPVAIVAATFKEMKAPAKFNSEAIVTAARGERARVEMDAATTLAVS